MSRSRKKEKDDKTNAVGEQFWVTEKMTDALKAAELRNPRLSLAALPCRRDIPRESERVGNLEIAVGLSLTPYTGKTWSAKPVHY